jgi:hypothetical protein
MQILINIKKFKLNNRIRKMLRTLNWWYINHINNKIVYNMLNKLIPKWLISVYIFAIIFINYTICIIVSAYLLLIISFEIAIDINNLNMTPVKSKLFSTDNKKYKKHKKLCLNISHKITNKKLSNKLKLWSN